MYTVCLCCLYSYVCTTQIKYVHIHTVLIGNLMLYVGLAVVVIVLLFLLAVLMLIFCRKRSSKAKGKVTGCTFTHSQLKLSICHRKNLNFTVRGDCADTTESLFEEQKQLIKPILTNWTPAAEQP